MTLIDANLLLYAYNLDAPQNIRAARWLTELLESAETIALPWVSLWAFIRISTNPRIWDKPLPAKQAFRVVNEWLEQPRIVLLQPGTRHREILESLVLTHRATGPLLTDAVLAALAIESGALLASTDQDFSRFQGLRWIDPISN